MWKKKYRRGKEAGLSACEILSLSTDLEIRVYTVEYSIYSVYHAYNMSSIPIKIQPFRIYPVS